MNIPRSLVAPHFLTVSQTASLDLLVDGHVFLGFQKELKRAVGVSEICCRCEIVYNISVVNLFNEHLEQLL
jgi:hypothetical protein